MTGSTQDRMLSLLLSTRADFRNASIRGDGYYRRMFVERPVGLNADGTADAALLGAFRDAVVEGREVPMEVGWYSQGQGPSLDAEVVVGRSHPNGFSYDQFSELAAGAVRCILRVPTLSRNLGLEGVEERQPDAVLADMWLDVLMGVAKRQAHPLVYSTAESLDYDKAAGWLTFGGFPVDAAGLTAESLDRARAGEGGDAVVQELRCGILRGSAFALELIVDRFLQDGSGPTGSGSFVPPSSSN